MTEKKKFKMPKAFKIGLISIAGLFVFLMILAMLFPPKEEVDRELLNKIQNEKLSQANSGVIVTGFRAKIAKQELDGSAKFTEKDCQDLKNLVIKFKPTADWFSYCSGTFYVSSADTANTNKIKIADGKNCATITTNKTDHSIEDYTFENVHCRGVRAHFE